MGYLAEGRDVVGLSGSYTVESALPRSGFGQAFVGHDASGARVLLKEVHVGESDAWKRVDALLREARTTLHLRHSHIARFVELFTFDGAAARPASTLSRETIELAPSSAEGDSKIAKAPSLVLVRAFVEGATLAEAIRDKRRFTAVELEKIFRGLLDARLYLDTLLPHVIHGDVSPSNVVIDAAGEPWLIDFGAVAENVQGSPSAAVGTAGFMAPEQLSGRATNASDLYAIAMTVLSVASHRAAHDMPIVLTTMRIPVSEVVSGLPKRFERALSACLEPSLSERVRSAEEALALLDAGSLTLWRARKAATERLAQWRSPALVAGVLLSCALPASVVAVPMMLRRSHSKVPMVSTPVFIQLRNEPPSLVPTEPPVPATTAIEPVVEPPVPPPTMTSLQWLGRVASAKGELEKGDPCVATLEVDPAATACTVTLACKQHVVVDHETVDDCSIAEIALNATERAYRAAFVRERIEGTASVELAFDDKNGLFRATRLSDTDVIGEDVTVKLDGASVARTGDYLYPSHRFEKRASFRGTVVRTSGPKDAAMGDSCTYALEPGNSSESFDNGQNCHARVRCGTSTLYDGFGSCNLDSDGKPVDFDDNTSSLIDGDPGVSVSGNELTVTDVTAKGRLSVLVHLDTAPTPHESE